jgi:LacI family transcriptional regulator
MVSPPLTTVRIGHAAMGSEAARLLLREIEEGGAPPRSVVLRPELVVRASTAAPRRSVRPAA